jgi:hypothetical protein
MKIINAIMLQIIKKINTFESSHSYSVLFIRMMVVDSKTPVRPESSFIIRER